MDTRRSFAYVVAVDGPRVTLNLKDSHRGHVSAHEDGISSVTDIGSLFGVEAGHRLLVLRVRSLNFAEPKEAHRAGVDTASSQGDPLRNLVATAAGYLDRQTGQLRFVPDALVAPPLGGEAYPLTNAETAAVFQLGGETSFDVSLGDTVRGFGPLRVDINQLLPRHIAVLGGTGYGKSCFTAAVLQQLVKYPNARIVVFDVNGEYADALQPHVEDDSFRHTVLGGPDATLRIPYYALGRHGLSRMLLPSEKTQRPALAFALEKLQYVEWKDEGVALVGDDATLFDDCRSEGAEEAAESISALRNGSAKMAKRWPPMYALACLIAESHALTRNRQGKYERSAFHYGNVAPLITRVHRCLDDPLFTTVVETTGSQEDVTGKLSWQAESRSLVAEVFGDESSSWRVHVVNLRNVTHDQMPLILGSLLELFAFALFERGQGKTHPTLLVLEEAHHYLRQFSENEEGGRQTLAYERLAKEGRKFGLSLWLSTQRPSEVSPTVLAQCGTWVAFRLSGEADMRSLGAASEWVDKSELSAIAGLPRQQALVLGASVSMPVRITAPTANPVPRSHDPDYSAWQTLPGRSSAKAISTRKKKKAAGGPTRGPR